MNGSNTAGVLVVGSANRDYVSTLDRLPRPGETVLGADLTVSSGGKGANQAVAAATYGARCALVACVGDDADGRALVASLVASKVEVNEVATVGDVRTGAAFVLVTRGGENSIVVAPGANSRLRPGVAAAAVERLASSFGVVVAQAEIPVDTLAAALRAADAHGVRAVLNLAPFVELPAEVVALADPLVVNETEAGALLGRDVDGVTGALEAAASLVARARSVVVTLGPQGAVVVAARNVDHVAAYPVDVVDSTGAGDAFTGVLAAALSFGDDLLGAVRCGVAAGTIAVGHRGAQASLEHRGDVAGTSRSG
ncbi:MAG: ribokinase [Nocardioidaceae bacterium]